MIWLAVALVVVGLPLAALLFGAESRDGRDWQPLGRLPNPSPGSDWPFPHIAGADGVSAHAPRRERIKQG